MAPLDRIKKKNNTTISVAMLRMKPMSHNKAMNDSMSYQEPEEDMGEEDMMEDKAEYGSEHCPKCAEYQMLIGEALAYYIQHKDDSEDKPDTSEVENETESKMDSEKA
jgi:hypothetical protein